MVTDNRSPAVSRFALLALAGILLFGTAGCHPRHGHYHGGSPHYAVLVPAKSRPVPHLAVHRHKEPPRHAAKAPTKNHPAPHRTVHAPSAGKGNPPRHAAKAPAKNHPAPHRAGHAMLADKGNPPR